MARKRNLFQLKISTILKRFLLGLCCVLFILLTQGQLALVLANEKEQAQQLTRIGHKQLQHGEAKEALKTWEIATKIYLSKGNSVGVTGSLINQSLALESLGLIVLVKLWLKLWS